MKKDNGIQTRREFDTPTWLVALMNIAALISIIMSIFADSLTMFPNEKYGYYLATIMAIGLAAHVTHVWCWGRIVTYGPIDLYRPCR